MFAKVIDPPMRMVFRTLKFLYGIAAWQSILIHEYGHYLGCVLTKTKVTCIVVGTSFLTEDGELNPFAERLYVNQEKKHFIAHHESFATLESNGGIIFHHKTTPFKYIIIGLMGPLSNIASFGLLFLMAIWLSTKEVPMLLTPIVWSLYFLISLLLWQHICLAIQSLLGAVGKNIKKDYKEWREQKTRT